MSKNHKDRPNGDYLEITNRALIYGAAVYPISNIVQVRKYEIKQKRFSWILLVFLLLFGFAALADGATFIFGLLLLGIAGYLIYLGINKPSKYAFAIETNAGSSDVFLSSNETFIDNIIRRLTEVIHNPDQAAKFDVNIVQATIQDNSVNVSGGSVGDVIGGANNASS